MLGCAQTGTGKTAAFALPILHRLLAQHQKQQGATASDHPRNGESAVHAGVQRENPRGKTARRAIRCLVLCPTRELASQIAESFRTYGRNVPLKGTVVFGGVSQHPQTAALKQGVDILVATPGRLMDLMEQGWVDLRHVECFVLDEADRMLDMGFIDDIRRIAAALPREQRPQTLLFSATMPPEIRKLAESLLRDPVSVQVAPVASTADRIDQSVHFVEKRDKGRLLAHVLDGKPVTRALVFTRTKHGADRVVSNLFRVGVRAEAIHGDKSQNARQRALGNFRAGKTRVLVATDIAARGIDVDSVSHVINYDVPHEPETYVHRIGRTARAGAEGKAISFCSSEERAWLRDIERLTRKPIEVLRVPVMSAPPIDPDRGPIQAHADQDHHAEGHGQRRHNHSPRRAEPNPHRDDRPGNGPKSPKRGHKHCGQNHQMKSKASRGFGARRSRAHA
ncbi:MAG: DEAD/DEAH box helicase [Myxococcota bacterium]